MRRDTQYKTCRTCKNCVHYEQNCCGYGDKSRNPRARAIKCRCFVSVVAELKRLEEMLFSGKEQNNG